MIVRNLKPPAPLNDNAPSIRDVMFASYQEILKCLNDAAEKWGPMPHDEFNAKFQALMLKHFLAEWPEKYHGE